MNDFGGVWEVKKIVIHIIITIFCGIGAVLSTVRLPLQKPIPKAEETEPELRTERLLAWMKTPRIAIIGNAAVLAIQLVTRSESFTPEIQGSRLGISWLAIIGMVWGMIRYWCCLRELVREEHRNV